MTPTRTSNPLLGHVALLGVGLLLLVPPLIAALEVTPGEGGVLQGHAIEAGGRNGELSLANDANVKHAHGGAGENGEKVLTFLDSLIAEANNGLSIVSSEQAEILKKSYLRVSDSSEMAGKNTDDSNCRWTGCERGGCADGEVEKDSVSCGLFYNNEYCCKPTPTPTPPPTPLPTPLPTPPPTPLPTPPPTPLPTSPPTPIPTSLPTPPPTHLPTPPPTDTPTTPSCRWTECEIGGCLSDEIEEDWESCGLFHPNREYCCKINQMPLANN